MRYRTAPLFLGYSVISAAGMNCNAGGSPLFCGESGGDSCVLCYSWGIGFKTPEQTSALVTPYIPVFGKLPEAA